jgi:hypothetical protein
MSHPNKDKEHSFPDDLQKVADMLRDGRPRLDPLALDRVKLRAMSGARRSTSSRAKGFFMRSRLTTALTVAFLSLGTGGALAVAGGEDFGLGSHDGGSASCEQYRPGNGFGDKNHCHTGPPGQEGKDEGHGQSGEHGKAGEEHGKAGKEHGHGH